MKIVVDENITYAEQAFSGYGDVVLVHGRNISNEILFDADALIARSITEVNEELLRNTAVKFVGTATIGVNHIDLNYLKHAGIGFADAKGSNANAVTEYVYTVIAKFLVENDLSPNETTLGIIGRGNIGGRIAKLARYLGFKLLVNDPPLKRSGVRYPFSKLAQTLQADILTIHTPLTMTGEYKTHNLISRENIDSAKKLKFFINTSRGETAETAALLSIATERKVPLCLDVWENEPFINARLLESAKFATPHIAGYSLEGKINGTLMMRQAMDSFFMNTAKFNITVPKVENNRVVLQSEKSIIELLYEATRYVYKIETDTIALKKGVEMEQMARGKYFDKLRKNYSLRREFSSYMIELEPYNQEKAIVLRAFRFTVV